MPVHFSATEPIHRLLREAMAPCESKDLNKSYLQESKTIVLKDSIMLSLDHNLPNNKIFHKELKSPRSRKYT